MTQSSKVVFNQRGAPLLKGAMHFVFIAAVIVSLSSCARKISFLTSAVVPAARGDVKVKKDDNSNYLISIFIRDLAEVSRLQPPKKAYVVWMMTDGGITKNIGQINSSAGFLSNNLKASLEAISTVRPVKIFVSAEEDGNSQFPGSMVVLSTDNF